MKTQPVKEYVRRMEREIKIKQKEQIPGFNTWAVSVQRYAAGI